ncbi:GerAB/ArcD/ProY family transporter [Shimazuella kribbensis]|uniref:GerAB/ArcD/ProY family transporter n=1 Tax=Shimazuella kribbensis TaxID=139808 RepID=UPI00040003AE|nr:endospore germination permease [Shimazuella kribbensis]
MSKTKVINDLQVFFLFLAYVGITCHVIILPAILGVAQRDSWVSVLIGGVIFLALIISGIYFIMKQTKQENLYTWLKENTHPVVYWLVTILFLLNLLIGIYISFYDTIRWTNTAYLPGTPSWIIALFTIVVCAFCAYLGLETLVIASGLLVPIVILLGVFVMSGNIPMKDYSLLFPIMQHGFPPIWKGIIYAFSGWMEFIAILFFQQNLKNKINRKTLWITGSVLIMITLGPVIGSITEFGPITSSQLRYPAYEQWRLLTLGPLVEHVDFLSIYQWWVGSFIRISLELYLILAILQINKKKTRVWVLSAIVLVIFCSMKIPIGDSPFWSITANYFLPLSLLLTSFIFLFLLLICVWNKYRNNSRNGKHEENTTKT